MSGQQYTFGQIGSLPVLIVAHQILGVQILFTSQ